MRDHVHYLVRRPDRSDGLIYPSEIEEQGYVGFGAFYLMGKEGEALRDAFVFYAVRGDQLIEATLSRYRDTRGFFFAAINGVGRFLFNAEPIPKTMAYVGSEPEAADLVAIRRLRSWRPGELDVACRDHGFYFVGWSPRARGEARGRRQRPPRPPHETVKHGRG
jgi:hypothetical protein